MSTTWGKTGPDPILMHQFAEQKGEMYVGPIVYLEQKPTASFLRILKSRQSGNTPRWNPLLNKSEPCLTSQEGQCINFSALYALPFLQVHKTFHKNRLTHQPWEPRPQGYSIHWWTPWILPCWLGRKHIGNIPLKTGKLRSLGWWEVVSVGDWGELGCTIVCK